jgi:hypothetical protein
MSTSDLDEQELGRILRQAGLELSPEQVRAILPGAAIIQGMIARIRAPLPREAEPATTFDVEQRR